METQISKILSLSALMFVLATPGFAREAPRGDEQVAVNKILDLISDQSARAAMDAHLPDYYRLRRNWEAGQIAKIQSVLSESGNPNLIRNHSWAFANEIGLAQQQHPTILKFFLDHGMDGNVRDPKFGEPILTLLSLDGKRELVGVLANDPRVDVNAIACEKGILGGNLRPVTALDWSSTGAVADILIAHKAHWGSAFPNHCAQSKNGIPVRAETALEPAPVAPEAASPAL